MNDLAPGTPARQFADDMAAAGAPVHLEGQRLRYEVVAVAGALAGQPVPTAVSLSEVQSWPLAPPHWVHLPDSLTLEQTNSDLVDCPPGWRRHSREFIHAGTSAPLATSWLRHVRGVVSAVIPASTLFGTPVVTPTGG